MTIPEARLTSDTVAAASVWVMPHGSRSKKPDETKYQRNCKLWRSHLACFKTVGLSLGKETILHNRKIKTLEERNEKVFCQNVECFRFWVLRAGDHGMDRRCVSLGSIVRTVYA